MPELCRRCPLRDGCTIKTPETSYGASTTRFSSCVHYTCTEGKQKAYRAQTRNKSV